jgi:hypothetical protein
MWWRCKSKLHQQSPIFDKMVYFENDQVFINDKKLRNLFDQ